MDRLEAVAARLIAVVGPTASGKTDLALALALAHDGEVVSCDSLQVYRGLDIGSAKPTPEQRRAVPHHLIDVADPDQEFSAAEYSRLARQALGQIHGRGRVPIVAGGTGLYLRALLDGLFAGPCRDSGFRIRMEGIARRRGDAWLHRLLSRVDPEAAGRIQVNDRVRVVRALEVYRATGLSIVRHQQRAPEPLPGFEPLIVGIAPGRDRLRLRVEQRTAEMFERGLIEEVRRLLARGFSAEMRPLRAIGYRQAVAVVRGDLSLEAAHGAVVTATMRYAKRQMTWFRHQASVSWHPDPDSARAAAEAWLSAARGRH